MTLRMADSSYRPALPWLGLVTTLLGVGLTSLLHCSSGGGNMTGCVERPGLCGTGLSCDPVENRCVLVGADLGSSGGDAGTERDGGSQPDMASPVDPAAGCSSDGICWVLPQPQGNYLNAAYAASPSAIWAVGGMGSIVFFDGTTWRNQVSGVSQNLNTVFGSDRGDVWAAGTAGTLLHYDGTRWTKVESGVTSDLSSGWASSRANAWLLSGNTPLRWDGVRWNRQPPVSVGINLRAIAGADPNNIWAVGSGGVARFDGSTWKAEVLPGSSLDLRALWVGSVSEVWVVGDGGSSLSWNGSVWTRNTSLTSGMRTVAGQPGGPVFASDGDGSIYRLDAGIWTLELRTRDEPLSSLLALPAGGGVGVGHYGRIVHRSGTSWAAYRSPVQRHLYGIWAKDAKNVWIVGDGGDVLYWNGSVWETQSGGPTTRLSRIFGTDSNNIWAVGWNGVIRRYTGRGWSDQSIPGVSSPYLYAVWASDANNVWVAGSENTVYRWNGTLWMKQTAPVSAAWLGMGGLGPNRVWVVGTGGNIIHWDGAAWRPQSSGVTVGLRAVHALDDRNVWAVGDNGTILMWDGTAWVYRLSPTTDNLYDVFAVSDKEAWAVGENGRVLRWDGKAWSLLQSPSGRSAYGLALADPKGENTLWVVGQYGSVLQRKKDGTPPTLR